MFVACNRHGEHQVCVCRCQRHDSAAESEGVQPGLVTLHPSITHLSAVLLHTSPSYDLSHTLQLAACTGLPAR